jgi:DNA-binding MurR/RpiR family transcriptional regulator
VNFSSFRFMCDDDLAERVSRLQRKVEELRRSSTAIGQRMAEQYAEALQAAIAELDRRKT